MRTPWQLLRARSSDEVDESKDGHPHDVDEVPVEAGDLWADKVAAVKAPPQRAREAGEQPEHADEDVRAVEAGEDQEALAEDAAAQGNALVSQVRELVGLAGEEARAKEGGGQQPVG